MPRFIKNLAASVKTQLLKYAENNNKTFDSILLAFGHERLFARLSLSTHRENYVLKGGVLIMRWLVDIGRETSDIDFSTIGEQTAHKVTGEFMEIMGIDATDGLSFKVSEVKTQPLKEKNTFELVTDLCQKHVTINTYLTQNRQNHDSLDCHMCFTLKS